MIKIHKNSRGFTLIELLVVIAIIGILSTLAIISLSGARLKSRDAKRFADMKQLSTALELFYTDNGLYPTFVTPGLSIQSPNGATTYMATIPKNPTPRADNLCADDEYVYATTPSNNDYHVYFCTGEKSGDYSSGGKLVSPTGFTQAGTTMKNAMALGLCGGFFGGRCDKGYKCCSGESHCYGEEFSCRLDSEICGKSINKACDLSLDDPCTDKELCSTGLCENNGRTNKVCVCRHLNEACVGDFNCCSADNLKCINGACQTQNGG